MNLRLGQLPSVWSASAKISEALSAPKLVVISFPTSAIAEAWGATLFSALESYLRIQDDVEDVVEVQIDGSGLAPLSVLSQALDQKFENAKDFLYVYSGDPAVALVWPDSSRLSPKWESFFQDIIQNIKQLDQSRYFRRLMIINGGNSDLPGFLKSNPAISHFRFWNALTWEELRLFAGSMLSDESNEIRRAWMVSSYCGASNFDLAILETLTQVRPKSISELCDYIVGVGSEDHVVLENDVSERGVGREWHPPPSLEESWRKGGLIGATIERGLTRPWNTYGKGQILPAISYLIWQEQVSGLFPLLIEFGYELNRIIFSEYPDKFEEYEEEPREPSEMLQILRDLNLWIKPTLYNALHGLRVARNQLAHLKPIDRADLEIVWDKQLRIRAGQH